MIFVYRAGRVVPKPIAGPRMEPAGASFPKPMLSPRFETMESPVTGEAITSWRGRDRDMQAAGAVDRRDLPDKPFEQRRIQDARQQSQPEQWGDLAE
jgi:hypothetical protein